MMVEHRAARLQLSMVDILKLSLASAAACACIAPSFRLVQHGIADPGRMATVDAVIVPLVFVLCSFVMVKRGPRRDRLITGLVLCSVLVALVALAWYSFPVAARFFRFGPSVVGPIAYPDLATAFVIVPAMAGWVAWLALRWYRIRGVDSRE